MAKVLTGISGNVISAASAGFAPTNSADVSAIASSYQVVSATATQLYAGTAYVTSVNDTQLSASRAGNAANASLSNSAWYDGTGRLISALPDSAAVSAIASAYAESAASSKQDTLTFGYDTSDKISSINGSSLAGEGGGLVTAIGTGVDPWYQTSVSSINGMGLFARWADSANNAGTANSAKSAYSSEHADIANYAKTVAPSALSSYMTAVSSPSGTVRISFGTAIDCTDSAVVGSYVAGSSGILTGSDLLIKPSSNVPMNIYSGLLPQEYTAQFLFEYGEACTVYLSGNNGESAEIWYNGSPTSIIVPIHSAIAVAAYTENTWIASARMYYTADTVDNSHVVQLAHASALPTYQYDAEDKISSINGSAIAGGAGGIDPATCSAIASAYAKSAISSVSGNYYTTANESGFLTAQAQASWSESASASPSYIQDKPDLVDIVAGPGIVVDNPDGNTLRVSMAQNYETVLWANTGTSAVTSMSLSEDVRNFDRFRVYWLWNNGTDFVSKVDEFSNFFTGTAHRVFGLDGIYRYGGTSFTMYSRFVLDTSYSSITYEYSNQNNDTAKYIVINKIVGINRTASAH